MSIIVIISVAVSALALGLAYGTGDTRGVWYFVVGVWQVAIWICLIELGRQMFLNLRSMADDDFDPPSSDSDGG